ncbi:MAG: class I SAM-dependent methyltransferase [Armatimonadetes bacterium]|nr:class I SAM-dependent methyltransferase [Armatimonadota bacterium]
MIHRRTFESAGTDQQIKNESKAFLLEILSRTNQRLSVRFWDGEVWPEKGETPVTLILNHPGALRAMFGSVNEVHVAEAYLYGDVDVEGDIESLVEAGAELVSDHLRWRDLIRLARTLRRLPAEHAPRDGGRTAAHLHGKQHSIERDKSAIHYHYDVSNEFFKLWLDERMVYSCAFFQSNADDIHTAQRNKLDYLCRKLRLKQGEHLLDIGCGWGSLVLWAAKQYGVDATGITLSQRQFEYAQEQIAREGLSDRCRVLLRDYREIDSDFDKIVSVGMVEHVGKAMLPEYFSVAFRALKPGGVFMNHGITCAVGAQHSGHNSFVDRYVFPDGQLLPIHETLHAAEEAGFEVRDVEDLREHYMMTLRNWVQRLEHAHDEAVRHVDELTYRVWRLYMAGSAYGFRVGNIALHQTLLSKRTPQGASTLPLTRADWYR